MSLKTAKNIRAHWIPSRNDRRHQFQKDCGLASSVKCYEAQLAASVSGEKPLYRPRTWQQEVRRQKKIVGKMAWFRPADTVLRVPFTPDSELAKEARAVVDEEATRLGLKVKVVEGSGVPLKRQITTSDLGAGKPCPQGNCLFF